MHVKGALWLFHMLSLPLSIYWRGSMHFVSDFLFYTPSVARYDHFPFQ